MISVNEKMFKEIEDFRYQKRFPTRSEATTELIRLGLESLKKEGLLLNNEIEENESKK